MTAIEKSVGRRWAIIVPSVIFGLGHIAYATNPVNMIFILVAGISVGIMFSLVVYESNSVWCSALIHAVWNAVVISGVINISTIRNNNTLFAYVLEDQFNWITGGFTTIEPSLISTLAYVMGALLAWYCMKYKNNKNKLAN